MKPLDPYRWAEVKPGTVLVLLPRCASSALCQEVRLKQGVSFNPLDPKDGFHLFRHIDFGAYLDQVPREAELVIIGRHPLRRFESARAALRANHANAPAESWDTLLAWAAHSTDPHVLPISRLHDRYFAERPHRCVRLEDYADWAPELGLPRRLPRVNASPPYERLPEHLVASATELYRRDFELFGYPLP